MPARYLLDTDICIHARRRRTPALLARFDFDFHAKAIAYEVFTDGLGADPNDPHRSIGWGEPRSDCHGCSWCYGSL